MANNDADLKRVIQVAVSLSGASIQRDNMNIVSIFSSQVIPGVFDSNHRQLSFLNANTVAETFGTSSSVYAHALIFFSQSPSPVAVSGGRLVISYWRATSETTPATSGVLRGAQLSEASLIGQLQTISDGSFNISIDGVVQNITAFDGRTLTSFDDVVDALNTAITGATVTLSDQRIIITSDTDGATSIVSLVTTGATGTYLGNILGLATGTGATSIDGVASAVLSAETKLDAVNNATDFNFKGFTFIDNPTDEETTALASYAQANDKMYYDVFDSATNLTIDVSNVCWATKLAKYENTRMLFRKDGDRKFATGYMARMHTVDFNGENTAITMHLKEIIGIIAESFTDTELDNASKIGLDTYVTFKNTPKLLTSGGNGYTDLSYNILAFKDALATDAFNLLGTTTTKVPQTQRGVNQLIDTLKKTCEQFKRAGFIGEGTWNSADFFGDLDTFKRNILQKGYYIYVQPLSQQTQADREDRKSPLVQIAVKTAGAFHSINILLTIEE